MPDATTKPPKVVPNLKGTVINYLVRQGNETLYWAASQKDADRWIKDEFHGSSKTRPTKGSTKKKK